MAGSFTSFVIDVGTRTEKTGVPSVQREALPALLGSAVRGVPPPADSGLLLLTCNSWWALRALSSWRRPWRKAPLVFKSFSKEHVSFPTDYSK